ncbi:zinc finger CCHC-type and RNA-binding motif-containing protein 1-like [Hydractinia symbiolongicarpus]|uniref:zinc finger CCHC-type and RNA-binding motif-containing protein 1-like n=1 Tax=Hydractinia symbiolongicarpus TaxID=13093 RepID=UPI00254B6158|nr:zinc finger CCHC-type and RNA-binding motif-containing protein 1-like [Hydractinia symbiolongicarpus]
MSGGLVPSKSTVYVGNLQFSLTNSDVHKVFSKFGQIVKVTILRDKVTRESKGVAFIQFIDRDSAIKACKGINEKELFGRKIKCVIAKDNGRAAEFIKKKEYPDKSSCYECGEEGHLSYDCPKNLLGNREPPPKKEKKSKKKREEEKDRSKKLIQDYYNDDAEEDTGEDLFESSLSYVIEQEAKLNQEGWSRKRENTFDYTENENTHESEPVIKKKLIKPSSYFSDEEEEDDE